MIEFFFFLRGHIEIASIDIARGARMEEGNRCYRRTEFTDSVYSLGGVRGGSVPRAGSRALKILCIYVNDSNRDNVLFDSRIVR